MCLCVLSKLRCVCECIYCNPFTAAFEQHMQLLTLLMHLRLDGGFLNHCFVSEANAMPSAGHEWSAGVLQC